MASSSGLARLGGLMAVLGGALWALWYVGASLVGGEGYQAYNRLMPVVLVLLAVGMLALHAAQGGSHGPVGRAGLVVALAGLAVMIVGNVAEFWAFSEEAYGPSTLRDSAWMLFGLGMVGFYVGTVLFGIGTLRARALPRLGALLLLVWFPLGFFLRWRRTTRRGENMYVELYPERVRALREEQGMTKRDLAAAAGISKTTARNAERGVPVRASTARRVAAALGVHPPQRLGRPAHRA